MKAMFTAFAAALACVASPALADRTTPRYTSVFTFGDSLVDGGNIAALTGGTVPNPAAGYFQGRFTNGYNYNDLLSIDLFGAPTVASLRGGNNYAYGGARIVTNAGPELDLAAQLQLYRNDVTANRKPVDANGLYILNLGGNDIFAVDAGNFGSFGSADAYIRAAANQYAQGVQTLNDLGVRNILITGFPLAASVNSRQAQVYLLSELGRLNLSPSTSLFNYDYMDFFTRVTTNPGAFGLPPLNLTTTCIQANAQASGCAGYFSFDGVHPTAAIQAAAYADMNAKFRLNAAIPEPSTWVMLIVGFGLVGAAMRQRRVRVAFATASR